MLSPRRLRTGATLALFTLAACHRGDGAPAPTALGDQPAIGQHLDQIEIARGEVPLDQVLAHGRALFAANFNDLDGAGRPESTGTGAPRARREFPQNFNRVSGPDANSCGGCHNKPRLGGGGDTVANVFVLGQRLPFVNFDATAAGDGFEDHTLREVANERNTLGMFGAGFIELLARELTAELHAARAAAIAAAASAGSAVRWPLVAKGIAFGHVTAHPDGSVDTGEVRGIDPDLVVRPFHQKGVVASLREFSNNALNHHHGMQASERFGAGVDADGDGLADELSPGDVTAITLWQATLPAPGRVLPDDPDRLAAVQLGEARFLSFGCAVCHVPELVLHDPVFTEPGPYNPAGNLQPADVGAPVAVDLTAAGPGPHLPRAADGSVVVRAYTDFRRHDMGPALANETLVQGGVPTSWFLTRKLWGAANEPPYLHHGRASTLGEAILLHGGEAQAARDAFAAGSAAEQAAVIEFLQTLQVLPADAGATTLVHANTGGIGDDPAVAVHLSQVDIEQGVHAPAALFEFGRRLFDADFNTLDGAGRPAATGTGLPRQPRTAPENFNRISGPDADSCAGCHNQPRSGGGGDNVANVFVLGQRFPFVDFDVNNEGDAFQGHRLDTVANERNTVGMFGAGYVELLAREMTAELQAQRAGALAVARARGTDVAVDLRAKGIAFGALVAHPDGSVTTAAVEGVDADLVVRPFHQKGVVVSLREFTNNAMNHHHGMQASERFGAGHDHDGDGHQDELTVGDVTAVTLYQAMLPVPGRVLPADPAQRAAVERGEARFTAIGCADCHVPFLRLDDAVFTEPNAYNPPGNLQLAQVAAVVAVDLTTDGPGPHLRREADGSVRVPLFSDLKRHDLGPECDNEHLVQAGVPTSVFLTRKLWGMASEPPFLHHGRALTIDAAIRRHGGEAAAARDAYLALPDDDRRSVVDFLKTLQVVPENGPLVVER
ncbi:MAG: hypothetical protein JNL08_10470 [Planctomycetes bacterium]|nr:hypothetical protein [Planctomycetota bacterium]